MESTSGRAGAAALFDHLVRCETRLYNAAGEMLKAEHGITTAQYELLRYLDESPNARVVEIAGNFAAGIGAISKIMDRLEAAGWVIRAPNPRDRRSSLINLTEDGRALAKSAQLTFDARIDELLGLALDQRQIKTVATALADLHAALAAAEEGIPVG